MNEHSQPEAVEAMLTPLLQGYDVGLMSEAGVPLLPILVLYLLLLLTVREYE